MNSQCLEGAAQSNPCAAVASEQNSQADPCPCQDVCPSCPCDPAQIPLGVTSDSGPTKAPSSGEEPFTFETPGMCVMKFPLQKNILTVELCPPEPSGTFPLPQEELCATKTPGSGLENLGELCQELPGAALEPCTIQVLELGPDQPGQARGVTLGDPCVSQIGISMDPCTSQSGIPADSCVTQIGISADSCVTQSGISADPCTSQIGISTDPCMTQTGISADSCTSQIGISADPCMTEIRISADSCTSQIGISADPCMTEIGISGDPCASQSQGCGDTGEAKASRPQASPRSPFRLSSCTSSIVERCLSRCQGWFRPRK